MSPKWNNPVSSRDVPEARGHPVPAPVRGRRKRKPEASGRKRAFSWEYRLTYDISDMPRETGFHSNGVPVLLQVARNAQSCARERWTDCSFEVSLSHVGMVRLQVNPSRREAGVRSPHPCLYVYFPAACPQAFTALPRASSMMYTFAEPTPRARNPSIPVLLINRPSIPYTRWASRMRVMF